MIRLKNEKSKLEFLKQYEDDIIKKRDYYFYKVDDQKALHDMNTILKTIKDIKDILDIE
jgi:hypothetical protein